MADKVSITVCVVALTQEDYLDLDPGIQIKLKALAGVYDFDTAGKPYSMSPDEWQPFEVGLPIRRYLEIANLRASLLSAQLYDPKVGPEVLKKTFLYIIDPLVLTHTKKRDWLAREVQTTIYTAEKAFCIILPVGLPESLRKEIAEICADQLRYLHAIRDDKDSYEWQVENADRLQTYLKRLARQLGPKPDPIAILLTQAIFQQRGVANPDLPGNPQLIT